MDINFYWFDDESKDWGLYALFHLLRNGAENIEDTQHHIEWINARYDTVDAALHGKPSWVAGTPKPTPSFIKTWENFAARHKDWSREQIKQGVAFVQWQHSAREWIEHDLKDEAA